MREIHVQHISTAVADMCKQANYFLGEDVVNALENFYNQEESPVAKNVLEQIMQNQQIARDEQVPMCQDTGYTVIFIDLGQEVRVIGGDLNQAVNQGVRQGYIDGYLRKSIVHDPINRVNTGDNTPAVIHYNIVPGDSIKIIVAPKGGGSENMSAVRMLKPAEGAEGVIDFVVETVAEAGANPCPPVIIGVGIGGTFEKVAFLAKKALLRTLGSPHPDPFYAGMEQEILARVNRLGIGPQGFGGRTTALACHIEIFPAHIASMPAAVNINCHASRHMERII